MHDNSKGTSRLAEGGAHIGKTKWWIYLNLHPIYEVKSVVAKFTRQKRRQNKWKNYYLSRRTILRLGSTDDVTVVTVLAVWGQRGRTGYFRLWLSFCSPGWPSWSELSWRPVVYFLRRVFSNFLSKFTLYIGQEEVPILPPGPLFDFHLF